MKKYAQWGQAVGFLIMAVGIFSMATQTRLAEAQEPLTEIRLCGVHSSGPQVTAYFTLGTPCPDPRDQAAVEAETHQAKIDVPSPLCTWVVYVQPGEAEPYSAGSCPQDNPDTGLAG